MARVSYGPEAKKRAKRLFEALLVYANDALECDEALLDTLQSQIQIRWQSETRFVIRTKVRFLQNLTGLLGQNSLNAEQIKEALKRFADFIAILEDNRSTRGGSENWHFTLNIWHHRHDIEANLQRFDEEWERKKAGNSTPTSITPSQITNQSPSPTPITPSQITNQLPSPTPITPTEETNQSPLPTPITPTEETNQLPWQNICRSMLQSQQRLTTNPLTSIDGVTFKLDAVYVPLGLVERKQRERRGEDILPTQGSRLYESEDAITQTFTLDTFLQQLQHPHQEHRIAIVGEPGAGKTTLLQKVAGWLLENTEDLTIWVSLADLQGKTLEDYLIQDWLRAAIRKRHVPLETEEAFCELFNQKKVWLLLDAIDEMAMESSHALTKIASFLTGWIADAKVILTCRLNVWDAGKNSLESFITYRNLNFTYGDGETPNLVGQFIRHWFQDNPTLGQRLETELQQGGRLRIKDAVKNPLRLALMCRTWGLNQGEFPSTKATLYKQFVEAIYEWKQDRFPTTSTQQQQLNQALGKLALQAISATDTKFRLSHRFICQVLGAPDEGMFQLALMVGWLNQVGISETQGEKVYAFYHPTFQEYFAALAIDDWRFFLNNQPLTSYRIFEPQWREVILLWLGRDDISQTDKDEFIKALIEFEDGVGNCYSYQAYFLAAAGISEFANCLLSNQIVTQLVKWRFGYFHPTQQRWWRYPAPVQEGSRVALLKTDRKFAILALEEFIQTCENEFDTWNAAYSLGRSFDPGNKIAIATLEKLVHSIRLEHLRLQAADSLGKVAPKNQIAIAALIQIIQTTKKDSIRRKAAYSLGKIDSGNTIALTALEKITTSSMSQTQRYQAAENLLILAPDNPIAQQIITSPSDNTNQEFINHRRLNKQPHPQAWDKSVLIARLEEGIINTKDEDAQRRRACRLALADPGNQLAFNTLVHLVKHGKSDIIRKRTADNFRKILLEEQIPQLIASLKDCFAMQVDETAMEQHRHCYKLVWHCAEKMPYLDFYRAWHQEIL